jgi:hypothetical protein
MANSYRDGSHLDAAIDRAVREMMSAEPRADLRERVLSELQDAPARTTLWPRLAFGSAALAVTVVAMLVLVDRPADRPVEQVAVSTSPAAESPRLGHVDPPAPARTASAPLDRGRIRSDGPESAPTPRGRAGTDRPIQAASIGAAESVAIAPMIPLARLDPIEPIALSRLDASHIPAPIVDIKPIAIEHIEIAPLTPQR